MNELPQNPTRVQAQRSHYLIDRARSGLLIIDVQEKLIGSIEGHSKLVWNIGRLLDASRLFKIPVLATEQYPKGLGQTIAVIREKLGEVPEKFMFSCRECAGQLEELRLKGIGQMVLVGIETHVCVQQTALDLISMGFDVFVVVDAVGSRFSIDRETALERMKLCGAMPTTTEAVMFEWCETSSDPNFKSMSQLVRQTAPSPPT